MRSTEVALSRLRDELLFFRLGISPISGLKRLSIPDAIDKEMCVPRLTAFYERHVVSPFLFRREALRFLRHACPCSAHHFCFSSRCMVPLQSVEQYFCATRRAMNFELHFS